MPAPTEVLNPTFAPFISNRPSPVNPDVLEYYRSDTKQGFPDEQSLLAYVNSLGKGTITSRTQLLTQPTMPQASSGDPNQALAQAAARAGLSLDDYLKLAGGNSSVSADERATIDKSLGIPDLESVVFQPSKSTEQLYNDAYRMAGLSELKAKVQAKLDEVNAARRAFTDASGTVNENPWLSEASRVGRIGRLRDKAEANIGNLDAELSQLKDLYNSGINEVNSFVSRQSTDFSNDRQLNAAKLEYLLKKAETLYSDKKVEKSSAAYQYLPEYLSAKAKGQKPDTLTLDDGSVIQWNPDTSTFEMIIGPTKLDTALTEINGRRVLINQQTGEVIKVLGATGGGTGGPGGLDSIEAQLYASRGTDGKADPNLFQQLRSKSRLSPDQFDKRYGYLLSTQEQRRLGIAGGTTDQVQFLSPDYLKHTIGVEKLYELSGKKLGILTRDKQQKKEQAVNEYLGTLMASVNAYRQAGFSDQEILKMMQK